MIYRRNGQKVTKQEFHEGGRQPGEDFAVAGISNPWPAGTQRYISGAADFSCDPNAYCGTMMEAEEKIKKRGKVPFRA